MRQTDKKYHITDEGKIFTVMDDGSVTEIGDVSYLVRSEPAIGVAQPKRRKWMWIAIVSWTLSIIAIITIFEQYDKANSYINYLNSRNYELEQNLNQVQSALNTKTLELDSINQQLNKNKKRLNRMPITITGIQIANEDQYSQIIDDYGSSLYSNRVCYIKPKIYYTGRKTGTFNLIEKIVRPDGTVLRGDSSPNGATQKFNISSTSGKNGQYELLGFGCSAPGSYEAGTWYLQIWYDDVMLYSTNFIIQ